MTRRFYNPYFFLPVLQGRSDDDEQCVEFAEIRKGKHDHIRHDLYHPGRNTGRITCILTTQTPTFVGNRHIGGRKKKTTGRVEHYRVNGRPAFPANSLNGMIGSLMEALSNSALRVLTNENAIELLSNFPSGVNLLPWKGERTHITPAERIFGVVAEEESGAGDGEVYALAGRVRFSDAEPVGNGEPRLLGEQVLKILASPKPKPATSHNFYFHHFHPLAPGHEDSSEQRRINGRKYYLHQQSELRAPRKGSDGEEKHWWETRDEGNRDTIHQKIQCNPVAENQSFIFHICFHNLSDAELGLLLAAIAPRRMQKVMENNGQCSDDSTFWHRLGVGKPLGLGSVELRVEKLWMEDIKKSYLGWSERPVMEDMTGKINDYLQEAQSKGLIDPVVLTVLCELGDPDKVDLPVTYPVTQEQYDALMNGTPQGEQKLFRWHTENKMCQYPKRLVISPPDASFRLSDHALTAVRSRRRRKNNRTKQRRK